MRLADFIHQSSAEILSGAETFARAKAPAGVALSTKELRNHLPQILEAIVLDLRSTQTPGEQKAKSEGRAPVEPGPESAASFHGRTRAIAGFGVNQMIAEYRALRAAVLRLWAANNALSEDSIEDVVRFNESIDQAVAESLAEYSSEVESWRQIFLGALGHDLRGPLTAVVFTADMLVEKTRDTPYARHAERILAGGMRMTELLNDLLEYSRSKLGAGIVINRQSCDLTEALGDEVDLLRAALPQTSISFEASGPAQGQFDASRLREALHNLVANAAKYGEAGTDVRVGLAGDPKQVSITVSNTGAPISADALHAMFDPLRRGSKAASTGENVSLGLGLFIVREIARAHGGTATAASAEGVTTFSIVLPHPELAE